ncbi:prophage CP4-like integrase [Pseudogulbenkiania sp. NH8B]|nr:prophage CP4-like integrase [Pseudogulbenkiania sp. NH8B]
MALTKVAIDSLSPRADGKPLKVPDGQGLYVWVMPTGAKYWRLKYRFGGKEKSLAIGVYPEVSIKEARQKKDAARRLLADGVDPGEKKKAIKRDQTIEDASSFRAVAIEWHEKMAAEWAPRHAAAVLRSLEMYLFPALGDRPIAQITAMELMLELRKVEQLGLHDTTKRLRERCTAIFRRAEVTGRASSNPAAALVDEFISPVSAPQPALEQEDLPAFLDALSTTDRITLQTKYLVQLIMILFTRIGETVRAEWDHIDLEAGVWEIPPETRKLKRKLMANASAHVVPLPRQAVEIFRQLQAFKLGDSNYVFPSFRYRKNHMSEATPLKAYERMGYGGNNKAHGHVVTHGFRATASTILNEAGFNPDAIERQLSHKEPNKVRAAYNRAKYLEERRKMLQCWADYLDKMATGEQTPSLQVAVNTRVEPEPPPMAGGSNP